MDTRGLGLMGILAEPWGMVLDIAAKLGRGFSVLELGDQYLTFTDPHLLAAGEYKKLGAGLYLSVDGNGRGDVTFDLNRRVQELQRELPRAVFDLVTDFGTGEHIFDQAHLWRSIHALTRVGGFIVFDRPTQGYEGHCFHRSDESTFRDIADANSYRLVRLERFTTKRGELVRGVFRKMVGGKFIVPQQGRYRKILTPILR